MRILFVSEYASRGSGYTTIADGFLGEWDARRHDVVMLAFQYKGGEHPHVATIVPSDDRLISSQGSMVVKGFRPDVIAVAWDLNKHINLRGLQQLGVPYVGIFPVEADPLLHPSDWTLTIDTMSASLCESRFGTKLLNDAGLPSRYIPIGVDEFFRPPTPEERESARRRWNLDDRFIVYTVADNQERKNLAVHLATIALLRGEELVWPQLIGKKRRLEDAVDAFYVLNTKKNPMQIGYDLHELAERFGITSNILALEHPMQSGLDREALRDLYWCADAFLLLSKAEGLGLPVLEAMACGVPVVGGDHTGIAESLGEGRGLLVPAEYVHIDPFANQWRRWADPELAAIALRSIAKKRPAAMIQRARDYAEALTWKRTADVFEEEVLNVLKSSEKARGAPGGEGDGGGSGSATG